MQWIEAKVTLTSSHDTLVIDLICDVFYDLKVKGVVVDDPDLEPEESWAPDAAARPTLPAVTGYLPADADWESHRNQLEAAISRISGESAFEYTITYKPIDEEDWAESWKAFFHPRKITGNIVIKPTWRSYEPFPGEQIIELDPGMAFGTGTHPTTVLCIQLLEKYLKRGDVILDVGTGSGILLIAGAKLGASRLVGLDLDSMAVDIARRNLDQNRIDPRLADLSVGDLVHDVTGVYDIVVANILAEVIVDLLDDVERVVRPGGLLICSGIIEPRKAAVSEKMTACGFDIIEVKMEEEWVAMVGTRA